MMMKFKKLLPFCWIVAALLLSSHSFAQQNVSGQIVEAATGDPLPGATVVVPGTTTGTISDFEGNYSLTVPANAEKLQFSMVGFERQVVDLAGQQVINIALAVETTALNEVVVTGYTTNAATALQGTIAGLKVTQTTGQPGSTPSLVVRGGTSFSGTGNPLILIDGVPGSFYALNSDDIASMEVLKDAASTAIYGARAANGVILVTTKKGKVGQSRINFRAKFTTNERREDPMDYLGAADYVKFNRLGVKQAQDVMGYAWLNQFLTGAHAAGTGNNTTNSIYTTMVLSDDNRYLLE